MEKEIFVVKTREQNGGNGKEDGKGEGGGKWSMCGTK